MNRITLAALIVGGTLLLAGCASNTGNGGSTASTLQQAGSSTVFPVAEAWAEELAADGIQVTVAGGGSGAGASKLCGGEIDIGDMSRPMKQSEIDACKSKGVDPVQWTVAYDGITVVVSKSNTFVDQLTVDELKRLWESGSSVATWADLRPGWPAEPVRLFGPDSDSGTYEYFNEEILGATCGPESKTICPPRSDYSPSADDNVLVEGVASDEHALGYFGFAYFQENADRLRAVPIIAKDATSAVSPSFETIADGTYRPLARPIFMYTDGVPEDGTALRAYFDYAFGDGQALVEEVGYVKLDPAKLAAMKSQLGA